VWGLGLGAWGVGGLGGLGPCTARGRVPLRLASRFSPRFPALCSPCHFAFWGLGLVLYVLDLGVRMWRVVSGVGCRE